jgi:oligopeptide transport system substrate-binding protein
MPISSRDLWFSLRLLSLVMLILPPPLRAQHASPKALHQAALSVFRLGNTREIDSIDPPFVDGGDANLVSRTLNEGLLVLDPATLRPQPGLAESWTVSSDGRRYAFTLRENLRWSDGSPLTIQDFIDAFKRNMHPETGAYYAAYMDVIEGAEAFRASGTAADWSKVAIRQLSLRELEIRLKEPAPYFLELLAQAIFLPQTVRTQKKAPGQGLPLSSGPFRLRSWALKDKMILEKNPYYHSATSVYLDEVQVFPIEDPKTAWNMYRAGELDWIRSLPASLIPKLRKMPDFHSSPILNTIYLRVNTKDLHLKDPRVRRAISMAIDRELLAEKVLREGQKAAYTFVAPGIEGYSAEPIISLDIPAARRLLDEAGYADRKKLPELAMIYPSNPMSERIGLALSAMLVRNLGVRMAPRNLERGVFYDRLNDLRYQIARSDWTLEYSDPRSSLEKFTSANVMNNLTGFADPTYDQLIATSSVEWDQEKRWKGFRRAEEILVGEQAALIPLFTNVSINLWKPYVKGMYDNPRLYYSIRHVRLERSTQASGAEKHRRSVQQEAKL